ncbi:hypothetical protein MSG28_014037 [Choristoneura fumiferana]|uniref:Uncharacterized protein n=1 Tax=Choristoneura fumiferana TaxID=7141 RepID=A0ACC0JFT5_CHOFU|nr:hypothetical protein MSG28_014037 [Choristoneura fumiferana]
METTMSTPVNTISRENLTVLIRNNIIVQTEEFASDTEMMETDSPVRSKNLQPVSKKLFHSPMQPEPKENPSTMTQEDRAKKCRKRKQFLVPDGSERFKRAYIECDKKEYSQDMCGMRKKVLISLFHNKEYSMDVV